MSWKVLFVGDVHATPEELGDCTKLFELIERVALERQVDEVCLLGDSYHTHQVIRAEVMHFYRTWFKRWKPLPFLVRTLVGNHDYAGEGNLVNAMEIHEEQVEVVDRPVNLAGRVYVPYYADREKFVADLNAVGGLVEGQTLICHQTFHGALYENGFSAEDGVDAGLLPQKEIVSGHIHAPQTFGKVTYLGAPRWRILTDANVDRAIWLYEFDDLGHVLSKTSFDTGGVCRRIHHRELKPGGPLLPKYLNPKDEWRIDIYGPQPFIDQNEPLLRAGGIRVRTFCTDRPNAKVSESVGLGQAFRTFLDGFTVRHGTPKHELLTMAQARLHV